MASVSFDSAGSCRLLFMAGTERRCIRLGRISRANADAVKRHVEAILTVSRYGTALAPATAAWLTSIDDELHGRLAGAGLVESRRRATLRAFVEAWMAGRVDLKPFSRRNILTALGHLGRYFGDDVPMESITRADADAFRDAMAVDYSRSTVGRCVKYARQFFAVALRDGLIDLNPFDRVIAWASENRERLAFVDRPTVERLLAAERQPRYRRLIALARYGGLRVPSEIAGLDWADIDFVRGRVRIRECKTKARTIPLFPELREVLESDRRPSGPVVDGGGSAVNWRSHLLRVIARAGLKPWPRLFHNLRASRETELAAEYPLHVVCEWIGNSAVVATRHYLSVRDSDLDRAAQIPAQSSGPTVNRAANCAIQVREPSEKSGREGKKGLFEYARQESNAGPISSEKPGDGPPVSTDSSADTVATQLAGLLAELLGRRAA